MIRNKNNDGVYKETPNIPGLRSATPGMTLITCWRLEMANGKVLCFTDFDQDVIFENEKYLAGAYFTPNSIYSSNELGQDDFAISGVIDGEIITKEQLIAGDFANTYMEVFLLKGSKKIVLKTGWVGEVKYSDEKFSLEVNSLSSKTNNLIGKCYSSSCRAEFADKFCGLKKDRYSFEGQVTAISEENSFIDENRNEPDHYFTYGIIEFLTGENRARKYNVSNFFEKKITFDSVTKINIKLSDKYRIIAGCDKSLYACVNKFLNVINFRGEPFIPSRHKLLALEK